MSGFNIGAIIQARISSTRLPGKVLKELPQAGGITVLEQVIRRLKRSKSINKIIVATTHDRKDNALLPVIKKEKIKYFRGSRDNVLSRYFLSARENKLDIIIRVSGDCPCIDSEIVDRIIGEHLRRKADYTSNTLKRSFPRGLDVEVFNFDVLEKIYKNARKDYEKEHVTPYIYENPAIFRIAQVKAPKKLYAPDIRITLDTREDYALLSIVFDCLYRKNKYFNTADIIRLFKRRPRLKLINKKIAQKRYTES